MVISAISTSRKNDITNQAIQAIQAREKALSMKMENLFACCSTAIKAVTAHTANSSIHAASQTALNPTPVSSTMANGMANHLVFVAPSEPQTNSVLSPLTRSYDTWQTELETDMDREFLLSGVKHGFKILEEPEGEVTQVHCRNYRSTTDPEFKHLVESQIKAEISKGNYMICKSVP